MDSSYMLNTYSARPGHYQAPRDESLITQPSQETNRFSVRRKPLFIGAGPGSDYVALVDPAPRPEDRQYPPKTKPGRASVLRWWLFELLASVVSVASLLSIVIVLRHYDGVGLNDENLPRSLTLNGIIAVLATLNRVSLMVPVGAAMSQEAWLWYSSTSRKEVCHSRMADLEHSDAASRGAWGSLRFLFLARRRWLASVGALITIISLAFGAFTQQLITIGNFPVTSRDPSLLAGSVPRAETFQYYSGNPAEYGFILPFPFRAAVYNGMLANEIAPLTASCPTGNCTWPITPSLAICGECSPSSYKLTCNNTICNYTMPSGAVTTLTNFATVIGGEGFAVTQTRGGKYDSRLNTTLYVTNFDVVGAPYKSLAQGFSNATTSAAECALWVCVQAYNTTTTSNIQSTAVVANFSSINATFPNAVLANYTFPPLPATMNPTPKTNYTISVSATQGLLSTLRHFNGTASLDISNSQASNDYVDAVWAANFAHLDPWIKQLALSLTNALRNSTNETQPSHAVYDGTAYQLGVRVRWAWIILPAVVVLLSILFLVSIIVQTARSPVQAWKGSLLAFLFMDVDAEMRQHVVGHTDEFMGFEKAVGNVRVRLVGEGKGEGGIWRMKVA